MFKETIYSIINGHNEIYNIIFMNYIRFWLTSFQKYKNIERNFQKISK